MPRFDRRQINGLVLATGLPFFAACSSDTVGSMNVLPKTSDVLRPDWLSYSGNKEEFTLRPVGSEDLVGPNGQCATAAPAASGDGAASSTAGGIALQMTECDVVGRAGTPERVELGVNERGERTVVLTYIRGARPGIYRFASGRLASIERAPEAPAATRPQQGATAKKRG
jgi:hypothetical protein